MPKTIFPFDEINAFKENLHTHFDSEGHIASRKDCEDIIDEMLDIFILALANGISTVNDQFGTDVELDVDTVDGIVNKKIDGVTWKDRVWSWFDTGGTEGDIVRIAETEAHRDGNEAALETAKGAGATKKTWMTMLDDRVRDTHSYIEGVTVGIDEEFYTYDGDHAQAPGLFQLPENSINCRCELMYS